MIINRMIVLRERPTGLPDDATFVLMEQPVGPPSDGEVVLEALMLSIDPAMRKWIDAAPNYLPPVNLGAPMRSLAIGRVLESRDARISPGALVRGALGWQTHPTLPGAGLELVDEALGGLEDQLGLYSLPGSQPISASRRSRDCSQARPSSSRRQRALWAKSSATWRGPWVVE